MDVAHPELEALLPAQVEEAARAGVHRDPGGGEARLLLGVAGQQVGAALAPGQQQAGLLEGLADDGHPVGQAAGSHPEERAGLGVAPADAQRLGLRPAVEQVDGPTGEHVGAAHEVRAQVAPHHQDLERGPARGAGASRTSMTVAAGRISTGGGSEAPGGGGGGGPMEARQQGTGRSGRRPRNGGTP